jgi:hypothetical protein
MSQHAPNNAYPKTNAKPVNKENGVKQSQELPTNNLPFTANP